MAKSSNNRNFSIRIPEGLIEKIDNEVETFRDEASRSEFITDAVKFYLRYKAECREKMENQRLMMGCACVDFVRAHMMAFYPGYCDK